MRLLLRLPLAEAAEEHIFDAQQRSAAPDLLNAEVLHALRRFGFGAQKVIIAMNFLKKDRAIVVSAKQHAKD